MTTALTQSGKTGTMSALIKNYLNTNLIPMENIFIITDKGLTKLGLLEPLIKKLKLPFRLRDLGIPEEACNSMAKEAMKQTRLLVNNPRKIEESDAFNIYKSIW